MLEAAPDLSALRAPPGNRLEALRGNRNAQRSIRVNDPWRICFRWSGQAALEVELVDDHRAERRLSTGVSTPRSFRPVGVDLQAQHDLEVVQRERGARLADEVRALAA